MTIPSTVHEVVEDLLFRVQRQHDREQLRIGFLPPQPTQEPQTERTAHTVPTTMYSDVEIAEAVNDVLSDLVSCVATNAHSTPLGTTETATSEPPQAVFDVMEHLIASTEATASVSSSPSKPINSSEFRADWTDPTSPSTPSAAHPKEVEETMEHILNHLEEFFSTSMFKKTPHVSTRPADRPRKEQPKQDATESALQAVLSTPPTPSHRKKPMGRDAVLAVIS